MNSYHSDKSCITKKIDKKKFCMIIIHTIVWLPLKKIVLLVKGRQNKVPLYGIFLVYSYILHLHIRMDK